MKALIEFGITYGPSNFSARFLYPILIERISHVDKAHVVVFKRQMGNTLMSYATHLIDLTNNEELKSRFPDIEFDYTFAPLLSLDEVTADMSLTYGRKVHYDNTDPGI